MKKRLFLKVFFEKKKFLIMFIITFTLSMAYLGSQLMLLSRQLSQSATPDFQINGSVGDDGIFHFHMYNDMDGLSDSISEIVESNIRIYGVTVRNLLTIENAATLQSIQYLIFGVEDIFFENELSNYIRTGSLPMPGEREALIGSQAARHFNLDVGDEIDLGITLNRVIADEDFMQYVVSGILEDNVGHFMGGIFISRNTFMEHGDEPVENLILAYFEDFDGIEYFELLLEEFTDLRENYEIGVINVYFEQRYNTRNHVITSMLFTLIIAVIIMSLLLSYLIKGVSKKIGLLKALGISDTYIMRTFVGGLGIVILFSTIMAFILVNVIRLSLNRVVSDFLGYQVEHYFINLDIYLLMSILGLALFLVVYFILKFVSSKIAPRDAMIKI